MDYENFKEKFVDDLRNKLYESGAEVEYPDTFKCVGETDIDKTYVMPKTAVTYRKPRRISEKQRETKRISMNKINSTQ